MGNLKTAHVRPCVRVCVRASVRLSVRPKLDLRNCLTDYFHIWYSNQPYDNHDVRLFKILKNFKMSQF